ncbi:MAG: hypothetical protein NTV06_05585 [candidate division Zixibacteria bacterium]|nr:hypothetical protein [candidate division Zixibacteria bacterium]
MTIIKYLLITAMLIAVAFISGCTSMHRNLTTEPEHDQKISPKRGDAYLFDITVDRNGRKNSARLDIYQSGDSLSFFARGYLGKGVIKGLLVADSVMAYFPTENQFYSGEIMALLKDSCSGDFRMERLILELFRGVPPEAKEARKHLEITVIKDTPQIKEYRLSWGNGMFEMRLSYDFVKGQYIISGFEYISSINHLRFQAERRNLKQNVTLPPEKFLILIPETAARIYP